MWSKRHREEEAKKRAEEAAARWQEAGNASSVRRRNRWVQKVNKRLGEKDPDRASRYNEEREPRRDG